MKADNVKFLAAPSYEGLTIHDFLLRANNYPVIKQYLPDENDVHRLPRNFVINLMYSIIGPEVRQFVMHVVEERNQAVLNNQRMALELDQDIREAFERSTSVACKFTALAHPAWLPPADRVSKELLCSWA